MYVDLGFFFGFGFFGGVYRIVDKVVQQSAKVIFRNSDDGLFVNGYVQFNLFLRCRLLHNLIDNSINAAEKSEAEKESEINIQIENDYVSITTANGFDRNSKQKNNNKNHGYGLTIVKEICKKYSGDYSFRIENDTYFTYTKIKNEYC